VKFKVCQNKTFRDLHSALSIAKAVKYKRDHGGVGHVLRIRETK
jgi:hypothetical protein